MRVHRLPDIIFLRKLKGWGSQPLRRPSANSNIPLSLEETVKYHGSDENSKNITSRTKRTPLFISRAMKLRRSRGISPLTQDGVLIRPGARVPHDGSKRRRDATDLLRSLSKAETGEMHHTPETETETRAESCSGKQIMQDRISLPIRCMHLCVFPICRS